MKDSSIYICPECGNIALNESEKPSCCQKPLEHPLEAKEIGEEDEHYLSLEPVENEWHVSSKHPMTKDHFLSYALLVTEGGRAVKKAYPEWDFSWRITVDGPGRLYSYCTQHGLHYQELP